MRVISVNVGRPRVLVHEGESYTSSIDRAAVGHAVGLAVTGLVGDDVADHRNHGGPEKAVCVYAMEHYGAVGAYLGVALPVPSFGENITSEGLVEEEVCIGDTFGIGGGGAVVQVSQPRQPCFKLARKHKRSDLPGFIVDMGYSGFYFRVIELGPIAPGDPIELTGRPNPGLTVAATMRAMFDPESPRELLERLAGCAELSAGWRRHLASRLV